MANHGDLQPDTANPQQFAAESEHRVPVADRAAGQRRDRAATSLAGVRTAGAQVGSDREAMTKPEPSEAGADRPSALATSVRSWSVVVHPLRSSQLPRSS